MSYGEKEKDIDLYTFFASPISSNCPNEVGKGFSERFEQSSIKPDREKAGIAGVFSMLRFPQIPHFFMATDETAKV